MRSLHIAYFKRRPHNFVADSQETPNLPTMGDPTEEGMLTHVDAYTAVEARALISKLMPIMRSEMDKAGAALQEATAIMRACHDAIPAMPAVAHEARQLERKACVHQKACAIHLVNAATLALRGDLEGCRTQFESWRARNERAMEAAEDIADFMENADMAGVPIVAVVPSTSSDDPEVSEGPTQAFQMVHAGNLDRYKQRQMLFKIVHLCVEKIGASV